MECVMDEMTVGVVVAALLLDGIVAGFSLDKVIVQLPARRRMGVVDYAGYARAADLGNGVVFYAVVGVGAAVLTIAGFAVALAVNAAATVEALLGTGAVLSVLHSAATGRAAPMIHAVGRSEDTDAAVAPLLTRFARWSQVRAALQVATFVVVAAAVAVAA
jgi:hypothetical protein